MADAGRGSHQAGPSEPGFRRVFGGVVAGLGVGIAEVFAVFYAVVRVAYEEFYRLFGLTPEQVGIGQAAMVARTGALSVVLGATIASWIAVAAIVTLWVRGTETEDGREPIRGGSLARFVRRHEAEVRLVAVWLAFVSVGVAITYPFRDTYLPVWLRGAIPSIGLGGLVGLVKRSLPSSRNSGGDSPGAHISFPARAPVALWITILGGAAALALAFAIWGSGEEAARDVLRNGTLSQRRFGHLSVQAAPARVIPLTGDPLGVCNGRGVATLLGRHERTAYVVVREGARHEVVPLRESDYAVTTGFDLPQSCPRQD